jgi:riboflavin synthase
MFTGIIQDRGKILEIKKTKGKTRFKIFSKIIARWLKVGSSVSCNGVCLTVIKLNKDFFETEAILETLKRTNLGDLKKGDFINLEPSLRFGNELGGHFVLGHIDGTGKIASLKKEGDSLLMEIRPPKNILKFIAFKGSISCDGVSLTVAKLKKYSFIVALIPHTLKVTNLSKKKLGDRINLEVDMVARYLGKIISAKS